VRLRLSAAVAGAAVGLVLAGGAPAYASGTVPPTTAVTTTSPTSTSPTTAATTPTGTTVLTVGSGAVSAQATATPGAGGEQTLSPADLAAQIASATALADQLNRSNAGIAAAATKLDRLSVEANTLLQEFAKARDAERAAREEANRDVLLFQQLSARLGEDRRALGQWAYQAYAGGSGSLDDMGALLDTLTKSAAEASDTAAQLSYLSDQRTSAFERVRDHAELQRDIAARAVEARTRAIAAAQLAADAKAKLDAVIVQQKNQLDTTRRLHATLVTKVGPINGLLLGSGDAAAREAARTLIKAVLVPGVAKDGSVTACSNDNADYPNGHIPASALCPLYGDPSQSLRPTAAAAFNALSLAYQRDTGTPICITDSYRSFAEQLMVKAERGAWAATPGTSEHGMGRAVDLCGGIQDFGSPAHLWMKQNAPLYGWFHPDWAEPTGALPEPWHWEYAG
jgi:D-alanyl-D-alanine carboxypeptidase